MNNHFGGVIWTNHALDRLRERGIKQGDAWATWNRPQESKKGASGNWIYYRNWGGTQIEVVAKQNDQPAGRQGKKEWIILSVWSRPAVLHARSTIRLGFWKSLAKILFSR